MESYSQPGARRWPSWIFRGFVVATCVYVLMSLADWLTFHPSVYPLGYWEAASSLGAEDVQLIAADGTVLHAWWAPAASHGGPATVFLHGNAGNLTHRTRHISAINRAGSGVLILDYRGYGKSEGSPTERGVYLDAVAAYDWLAARTSAPIVCHGESLGTAVAAELAVRRECAGLVLEAPFPSRQAVAARVLPVLGPWLARGFDTASKLASIHAPLLVIHGDRDQVISHDLGEAVFSAANEPKELWTLSGAGHNDIVPVAGPRYSARLAAFYAALTR